MRIEHLNVFCSVYSHRHEADQDDNHLGQLEEIELLLLHTALPLLLSPVNITIEKLYYSLVLIYIDVQN